MEHHEFPLLRIIFRSPGSVPRLTPLGNRQSCRYFVSMGGRFSHQLGGADGIYRVWAIDT